MSVADGGIFRLLGARTFAEILPRFISKPTSHKAHKRIFSDRDPLFYWLYALGDVGSRTSLGFITPRSSVRVRPPLPIFPCISINYRRCFIRPFLPLPRS